MITGHLARPALRENDLWDWMMPITAIDARPGLMWATRKEILQRRGLIADVMVRPPAPAIDPETRVEITQLVERLGLNLRYPVSA